MIDEKIGNYLVTYGFKENDYMNFKQALSWLSQPGIKALMPKDKDTTNALNKAMEALEKQMPIEIKDIHVDEYYCPACGSENGCDDKVVTDNYCPICGQKIFQKE